MVQRLPFEQVIDGLWNKGLSGRLSPELREGLKRLGLDLSKKLDPAYPAEQMRDWIRLTAQTLYPGLPADEAQHKLGCESFRGFTTGGVGAAMREMLRAVGTKRALERMQNNLRTGNNYMETRVRELGPNELELWLKDANGVPAYYAGMIDEGARATGVADVRTTWSLDGDACTYRVVWTAPPA
jgi:uncharacterized protein (TIGR02265 family)